MRVVMIGTGYVGLVSGACFADFGHSVTCIDKDAGKIARLRAGIMPIYEPGLDVLVERNVAAGRLSFATEGAAAVPAADVVFLAVGTPTRRGDGHADLSYVYAAAQEVALHLSGRTVVVTKSTVPVGTGDQVEAIIRQVNPSADVDVASNPEFLREGAAIDDFKRPDRVVVGTQSERATRALTELYRPLYINETPMLVTDRRTAELIKYAANAFLATKITFINEIADVCEAVGADVQHVARGIGLDRRIGPKFLHAGPGYGGSCFPKDTLALSRTARDCGQPTTIVDAVIAANERRKSAMADVIVDALGGDVRGATVAILGVTFKPNTDDMRDAPSLAIVPRLAELGARVVAYDPAGMASAAPLLPEVTFVADARACLDGADVAVVLTEWDEFRALDLADVAHRLARPILVDLRNVFSADEAERAGLAYRAIGRPSRPAAHVAAPVSLAAE